MRLFSPPPSITARRITAISQINAVTAPIFSGVELSPVPVLLPFDSALYLSDQRSGAVNLLIPRYQSGFNAASMFEAGPAGYDAVFMLERGAGEGARGQAGIASDKPWRLLAGTMFPNRS
mgnify:CR=1 FL=1